MGSSQFLLGSRRHRQGLAGIPRGYREGSLLAGRRLGKLLADQTRCGSSPARCGTRQCRRLLGIIGFLDFQKRTGCRVESLDPDGATPATSGDALCVRLCPVSHRAAISCAGLPDLATSSDSERSFWIPVFAGKSCGQRRFQLTRTERRFRLAVREIIRCFAGAGPDRVALRPPFSIHHL